MLDTYLPEAGGTLPVVSRGVDAFARDVRTKGIANALAWRLGFRIAFVVHRFPALRRAVGRRRLRVPISPKIAFSFHYHMTNFVRSKLAHEWRPGEAGAATTLFRSESHPAQAPPDLGWSPYTPALAIEHVPGTHSSMLAGENAAHLAHKLREAIAPHL